jgi:hypothetical protein
MGSTWTPTPPPPDATGEALALLCGSHDPRTRVELDEAISRHSAALDARAIAVKLESRLRGGVTPHVALHVATMALTAWLLRSRYLALRDLCPARDDGKVDPETEPPLSPGEALAGIMHEIAGPEGIKALARIRPLLVEKLQTRLASVNHRLAMWEKPVVTSPNSPHWKGNTDSRFHRSCSLHTPQEHTEGLKYHRAAPSLVSCVFADQSAHPHVRELRRWTLTRAAM